MCYSAIYTWYQYNAHLLLIADSSDLTFICLSIETKEWVILVIALSGYSLFVVQEWVKKKRGGDYFCYRQGTSSTVLRLRTFFYSKVTVSRMP